MGDQSPAGEADEAPNEPSSPLTRSKLPVIDEISSKGNIILDVTFKNSKATLDAARKAAGLKSKARQQPQSQAAKLKTRVGFRVELSVLTKTSKYFEKLLCDVHFREAMSIAATFDALSLRNVLPAAAASEELPWVEIQDDDEATRYAHRADAFADMLRVLHDQKAKTAPMSMDYLASLAVFADRFDCLVPVAKYKWPVFPRKYANTDDPRMTRSAENVLRQKILVGWLLNQPLNFAASTNELIMNGSCKWSSFTGSDDPSDEPMWWYLQDGIEQELQFRRQCILNTIASIQKHFMSLYASRTRQCKLGYDSSAACDSYQLGETVKFLVNKNLMFLVDFSPSSLDSIADSSLLGIESVVASLRQCPSYQIDKHHTNCGLRARIQPVLDFIQGMLVADSIPISRKSWKSDREAAAWYHPDANNKNDDKNEKSIFSFTRHLSKDHRFKYGHILGTDRLAREVFTASGWDWTADE